MGMVGGWNADPLSCALPAGITERRGIWTGSGIAGRGVRFLPFGGMSSNTPRKKSPGLISETSGSPCAEVPKVYIYVRCTKYKDRYLTYLRTTSLVVCTAFPNLWACHLGRDVGQGTSCARGVTVWKGPICCIREGACPIVGISVPIPLALNLHLTYACPARQ